MTTPCADDELTSWDSARTATTEAVPGLTSATSLAEMAPDELYRLVASLQTRGKDTETAITSRQESVRRLRAAIDLTHAHLRDEHLRTSQARAELPEALRLADLAERVAGGAAQARRQATATTEAAREALWHWLETVPALSEASAHDAGEGDVRSEPLRTVADRAEHGKRATPQPTANVLLTTLRALAERSSATTASIPDAAAGALADSTCEQDAADGVMTSDAPSLPARKTIHFADAPHMEKVIPVSAHNAGRQSWPQRRSRASLEEDAAASMATPSSLSLPQSPDEVSSDLGAASPCQRTPVASSACATTSATVHPATANATHGDAGARSSQSAVVVVSSTAAMRVAGAWQAPVRRRRTVWRLEPKS